MYFVPLTQYENDIIYARSFIRNKPRDYCTQVINFNEPSEIILVNAIEPLYQLRTFKKIIESNVATPDELSYIIFLILKACNEDVRFAYGHKIMVNSKSWVEINKNGNYYILDPVMKNIIQAPNPSYIPIFAFDGENLIFIDNNM